MLIIYDKDTTSFDNLGLGVLRDFKSEPLITEVLNGLYNLEFDYVRDGWLSESLIEENLIKANGQLFRIWNIKKSIDETKITILAKHIFFDLEKSNFLEDVAPTDKTAENALSWILDHAAIPTNFKVNGDCTKIASARYVRMNPIEAIYNADNCILSRFGGEIELDNYNITIHNKRGNDLGLEIRQRKNLNGADYQLDLSTIATRIMPIGRDGLLLPEKYIDSPLINNYFSPFYYKFDVDVGVDEENGITLENCYQEMRNAVQNLYDSGIDKPQISISIDFVELSKTVEYKHYSNLETAHLGDSCRVFIPSLNLNLITRIVKIVYNCSKDRITSMELGTPIPNYVTSAADVEKNLKNAISTDSPTGLLQQAKNNATSMLKHPFTGYMYISEETGEFYLMDTKDINTAQSVWKFGLGGIGYSSTGINGEYQVAITQDGQIVADFITTGTLAASRIEGYNQLITTVSEQQDTITNINANLTDTNTNLNTLQQALTTIRESIITQSAEAVEMLFKQTGIEDAVNAVETALNDAENQLNIITEYVRFEGAKIILGKSTSQSSLIIENDIIKFMTGNNISAYISENQLYITDSTILNKLQIGKWETKPDSKGNLNTRWVGGN